VFPHKGTGGVEEHQKDDPHKNNPPGEGS
jgi:hypothetical protein